MPGPRELVRLCPQLPDSSVSEGGVRIAGGLASAPLTHLRSHVRSPSHALETLTPLPPIPARILPFPDTLDSGYHRSPLVPPRPLLRSMGINTAWVNLWPRRVGTQWKITLLSVP